MLNEQYEFQLHHIETVYSYSQKEDVLDTISLLESLNQVLASILKPEYLNDLDAKLKKIISKQLQADSDKLEKEDCEGKCNYFYYYQISL